jgi:hypothetical protein
VVVIVIIRSSCGGGGVLAPVIIPTNTVIYKATVAKQPEQIKSMQLTRVASRISAQVVKMTDHTLTSKQGG